MTNTMQDRVKTEWEKAQKEGGQRLERIRDIVKAAAIEAFAELREGSGEIETQGRKTLAEMIEQLKANEAADEAAAEAVADAVAEAVQAEAAQTEAVYTEATNEANAPTWDQIFADLRYLADERKVGWAQQLLASMQTHIDRFDADMANEYGDRYKPFRTLVRGVRSLIALAYSQVRQAAKPTAHTPVQIEVIEVLDDAKPSGDSTSL